MCVYMYVCVCLCVNNIGVHLLTDKGAGKAWYLFKKNWFVRGYEINIKLVA